MFLKRDSNNKPNSHNNQPLPFTTSILQLSTDPSCFQVFQSLNSASSSELYSSLLRLIGFPVELPIKSSAMMSLLIHWNELICFAIVAGAIIFSIWLLVQRESGKKWNTKYESLLISQSQGDDEYIKWTNTSHVSSSQLWTSCWKGLSPIWLLAFRLFSFFFMAGLLAWDIRRNGTAIFIYYTEWTFSLVIVYFALATIISAHGCWENSKIPVIENEEIDGLTETNVEENRSATTINLRLIKVRRTIKVQSNHEVNEQRAGFWGYLMQTIYQTCAGAVMLTDTVFWGLIVPFLKLQHFELNPLMVCMHTLNAVFLLLDTALNRLPFPWFGLAYFVLWSCLYVIFQWIVHACGFPWWPYPFLVLSTPWAPIWYFCMALVHIPCYGLYALIVKFKNVAFSKWFSHEYMWSN